jgi:hypothetical protein
MQKNVAGQKIGAQLVSATDGSAFTGSVTVYVTGDAGTQAAGSVGSGACTHEGNGYHTYAPAQAETNYDLIAFTFTGTGAVPATVQVYTRWNANTIAVSGTTQTARDLGASVLLSSGTGTGQISLTSGAVLLQATQTGVTIPTVTTLTNLPSIPSNWLTAAGIAASALNGKGDWNVGKTGYALTATTGLGNQTANITGNLSGSVGSVTGAVGSVTAAVTAGTVSDKTGYSLTATTGLGNQTANITGNLSGSVGSVTGAVGSVTGAVGSVTGAVGSVTGSVGSIGTGGIASTSFAAGAINASAIATGAIDADALAADAGTEIGTAVWASTTRTLTSAGSGGATAQEVWEYATRTLTSAGAGGATAQEVWEYATRTLTSLGNGSGLSAIPWNAAWDAEVQSECADALTAYDPPTNAEMEARTLVAADYATATALATVDTVVDAILDDTGTAGVMVASGSKAGYSLAAAGLDSIVVETGLNARQALAVNAAALAGVLSGAATTTVTVKGAGVATTRITATVDADGNRSVVTLALPS